MKTNKKKGISLIVLVITIIIMIILAASIILSLSGNNVIEKANTAKSNNDTTAIQEKASIKLAEYEFAKVEGTTTAQTAKEYIETLPEFEGYYANESGVIVATKYGTGANEVPIPLGFTRVEGDKNTGLVIADVEGNEFVWVPVDDFTKFQRTSEYNADIVPPTDANYKEPLLSGGYSEEELEYQVMRKSVENNKGFYIGRYEAGSEIKRTNISNGTTKMIVKKGAYVYNYVGWGQNMTNMNDDVVYSGKNQGAGAVKLSKNMYENSKSVVSTLCYGVQWDAALRFAYSVGNGWNNSNYTNNPGLRTGTDTPNGDNKWKNIYDLCGSLSEFTMEAYGSEYRTIRGNSIAASTNTWGANTRAYLLPNENGTTIGFRPALYLK